MEKIKEWINTWLGVVVVGVVSVALLFALGCCIYTAIVNPIVGVVGVVGVALALAFCVFMIWREVEDNITV
jgi:uncharacterized Tic20 family protein